MIEAKQTQFRQFVNERRDKVLRDLPTDERTRVFFVSGEKKEYVKSNLKILDKYINNFLNIRQSDIDAQMAEKGDRESVGSRSFAKHMKPNMLTEFDNAWKQVTTYLQYDVFCQFYTKMPKLPVVSNQGEVIYKDIVKEIGKDVIVSNSNLQSEYMVQRGPVYSPTAVFTKTEPVNVRVTTGSPGRDAWDIYK